MVISCFCLLNVLIEKTRNALQGSAKNVSREVRVGACLQKAVAGVEVESAIHLSLALRPCDALHALFRL